MWAKYRHAMGEVDEEGRGEGVVAQTGPEGHRLPMPPPPPADDPASAFGAPAQSRNVGGGAGFIEKDQPRRIESGLRRLPGGARFGDIRPLLLAGVHDFF